MTHNEEMQDSNRIEDVAKTLNTHWCSFSPLRASCLSVITTHSKKKKAHLRSQTSTLAQRSQQKLFLLSNNFKPKACGKKNTGLCSDEHVYVKIKYWRETRGNLQFIWVVRLWMYFCCRKRKFIVRNGIKKYLQYISEAIGYWRLDVEPAYCSTAPVKSSLEKILYGNKIPGVLQLSWPKGNRSRH